MGKLSELPNIGETVAGQLNQVGMVTEDDLKKIGAKQAWLQIQAIDESACIHRLLALEGGNVWGGSIALRLVDLLLAQHPEHALKMK
ncbi:MAG: TfoX/Sxy family DNA transformation protein [Syntrophomonadaceae bacterium]|nr:TfoX/Sxy family DNA transformation protein [Syntrophomonadaceae bacterium]